MRISRQLFPVLDFNGKKSFAKKQLAFDKNVDFVLGNSRISDFIPLQTGFGELSSVWTVWIDMIQNNKYTFIILRNLK